MNGYKPVSHEKFEKKAFAIPGMLEGYNELAEEFTMIAELIKARKMAGKTQKEVAKKMHTSSSVIARLEGGMNQKRHSPTLNTIRKYANAVGCAILIKLVPCEKSRYF